MPKAGALTRLFKSGSQIATKSTSNLFQSLDQRELTAEEQKIVSERVELQRKLLEQYELKENARKIREVKAAWPALTDAEAQKALDLCNGVEEDATLGLTSPTFMRRVRKACGARAPRVRAPAKKTKAPKSAAAALTLGSSDAEAPSRKVVDAATLDANIFVGKFGGRAGPQEKLEWRDAAALLDFNSKQCVAGLLAKPAEWSGGTEHDVQQSGSAEGALQHDVAENTGQHLNGAADPPSPCADAADAGGVDRTGAASFRHVEEADCVHPLNHDSACHAAPIIADGVSPYRIADNGVPDQGAPTNQRASKAKARPAKAPRPRKAPRGKPQGQTSKPADPAQQPAPTEDADVYRPVISVAGNAVRGRVKQPPTKKATLLALGSLRVAKNWYNAGYIFPDGYHSRLLFRSSVQLSSLVAHDCFVVGDGGAHWPDPTFVLVAADRADEPLVGKSCTSCWSQVLQRINAEIEAKRAAGEDLPPPPKTAIAGPEYFGFNSPDIVQQIEALDADHLCTTYWLGKQERLAACKKRARGTKAKQPPAAVPQAPVPRAQEPPAGRTGRKRGRDAQHADVEETYVGANGWSAVSRSARYRARCGGDGDAAAADADLMPGYLDPITLEPVSNPALGPSGHVMGLATWRAVLAEQGCCPFTKQPLQVHQLIPLTTSNLQRHLCKIIGWDASASTEAAQQAANVRSGGEL